MKLVATKLEMETVGKMSKLVIEHVDAISSDLTVLDSRLLLGNANIDVVALDGTGSLVLIAIDRVSDEQLLLKAVEAYSWCLEYPEAVRRLYPAADVSVTRPPRVMFVVERMSDSFHRKVKQLGFPEVDCVEFRHLAIDGGEAVHFDTIVRLRRATLVSAETRVSAFTPTPNTAMPDVGTVIRATSAKLQKLLSADTPSPSASRQAERPAERSLAERPVAAAAVSAPSPAREPGVVVSMMNRAGRHAAARLEEAALSSAPPPSIAPAAKQPVMPSNRWSPRDAEPAAETVGTLTVEPAALVPAVLEMVVEPEPIVAPEPVAVAPVLELVVAPSPSAAPEPVVAVAPSLLVVEPERPVVAVAPSLLVVEPERPVVAIAPALELVMEAALIAVTEPGLATTPVFELVVEPELIAVPEPVVAVAPVIELVVEPKPVAVPVVAVAPVIELVVEPEPVAAPVVAAAPVRVMEPARITAPAPVTAAPEPPRISFADLSKELLASTSTERKPATISKSAAPTKPLEPPASIRPAAVAGSPERLSLSDLSKELLGASAPVRVAQRNGPTPMRLQVPPAVEAPKVGELARAFLEQIEGVEAEVAPALESLVEAAAQTVPDPAVEGPEAANIEGLEGMKFPGEGVLTRQWMDFLNQMTATK